METSFGKKFHCLSIVISPKCFINPFVPNVTFIYPLKTENLTISGGTEIGNICNEWVKTLINPLSRSF